MNQKVTWSGVKIFMKLLVGLGAMSIIYSLALEPMFNNISNYFHLSPERKILKVIKDLSKGNITSMECNNLVEQQKEKSLFDTSFVFFGYFYVNSTKSCLFSYTLRILPSDENEKTSINFFMKDLGTNTSIYEYFSNEKEGYLLGQKFEEIPALSGYSVYDYLYKNLK